MLTQGASAKLRHRGNCAPHGVERTARKVDTSAEKPNARDLVVTHSMLKTAAVSGAIMKTDSIKRVRHKVLKPPAGVMIFQITTLDPPTDKIANKALNLAPFRV